MIEKFGHGGDLLTASLAYGLKADQFVDFSSNMNPLGPPERVRETILQSISEIVHYPDPACRKLKQIISDTYDVPVECIAIGNGAAELIDLTVRVFNMEQVVLARPCFSEYEEALHKAGSRIMELKLAEEDEFCVRQEALASVLQQADGVILGHPNNPTGRLLDENVLQMLADSGTNCILDEAFIDFIPEEQKYTQLKRAIHDPNWAVIRSMTKFYSIPGIRLGFMVAHPDRIKQIEAQQIQWSVNVFAQRTGEMVLQEEDFRNETLHWLTQERPWLREALSSLGFTVFPSDVNYLLVKLTAEWSAKRMQRAMGEQGVLIRDASHFPGLDERYIRVAIKTREDNMRLIDAFKQVMK